MCVFVPKQLTVGAVRDLGSPEPKNFEGCLENLQFNGLKLIEQAKLKDQQVAVVVGAL